MKMDRNKYGLAKNGTQNAVVVAVNSGIVSCIDARGKVEWKIFDGPKWSPDSVIKEICIIALFAVGERIRCIQSKKRPGIYIGVVSYFTKLQ